MTTSSEIIYQRRVRVLHLAEQLANVSEACRLVGVSRELYDPASGESKFSTGNKDTLAGATPAVVRAFYESHYTADHMALSLAGQGVAGRP